MIYYVRGCIVYVFSMDKVIRQIMSFILLVIYK